jgi:hypothetical protein
LACLVETCAVNHQYDAVYIPSLGGTSVFKALVVAVADHPPVASSGREREAPFEIHRSWQRVCLGVPAIFIAEEKVKKSFQKDPISFFDWTDT